MVLAERFTDLVMVVEDGCEVLNQYPKELQVVDLILDRIQK
ncbi:hypothetical protein [Desulfosporosinus fructosivorans]|nr:hypothetical protein [Desulfosporosinus fructosivorans]